MKPEDIPTVQEQAIVSILKGIFEGSIDHEHMRDCAKRHLDIVGFHHALAKIREQEARIVAAKEGNLAKVRVHAILHGFYQALRLLGVPIRHRERYMPKEVCS